MRARIMRLEITDFICRNREWEKMLAEAPYFVKVKRNCGFILLKYDQIRSDFSIPMVRECRGIILDESASFIPVCVPFFSLAIMGRNTSLILTGLRRAFRRSSTVRS